MNRLIATITIVALALATSPAFASPGGHERLHGRPGVSDGHPVRVEAHRSFEGRRDLDRDDRGRVFVRFGPAFSWGPAYVYGWDYPPAAVYAPPPQSYWYYCPSAGAYYPYVAGCAEAWVPVPAATQ